MVTRSVKLRDHLGEGIADAEYLFEPAFSHQLVKGHRNQRKVLGRATVGTSLIWVAAFQLQPLP